jgi:hypothetical protein
MAYIPYGQSTVGGRQVAEALADLQAVAAKLQALADWVNEIGPSGLTGNTDFSVPAGDFAPGVTNAQAFNDSFLQIAAAFATFYGDGSGGSNREKIARLARGQ